MLTQGDISNDIIQFVTELNNIEQKNKQKAIKQFATKLEKTIFKSIRKIQITIKPGTIIVTGANAAGPVSCTNPAPIVIQLSVT